MVTASLDDDGPLGPNDLRIELDDHTFQRLQQAAVGHGRTWQDLVIETILVEADRPPSADATLGADGSSR